jgi:hypothetical protein
VARDLAVWRKRVARGRSVRLCSARPLRQRAALRRRHRCRGAAAPVRGAARTGALAGFQTINSARLHAAIAQHGGKPAETVPCWCHGLTEVPPAAEAGAKKRPVPFSSSGSPQQAGQGRWAQHERDEPSRCTCRTLLPAHTLRIIILVAAAVLLAPLRAGCPMPRAFAAVRAGQVATR